MNECKNYYLKIMQQKKTSGKIRDNIFLLIIVSILDN